MNLLFLIISSFYLALPAYFANMAPVLMKWIPFNVPVHKRWFGKNKTWRGIIFAVIFGMIVAFIQSRFTFGIEILDYSNWLLIGFLLGLGAIIGDLAESFIKRRLGIKPGERFFPWDQLDFIIGGLVFVSVYFVPPWQVVVMLLVLSVILHVSVNHIAFYLGIRNEKW